MRNPHIDILKTIAITSVIIGHIFPSTHSFLRAHDIFFVIAGYFSMMSIEKYAKEGIFHSYFKFITRRLWRFLPIIAIAGILCLAWGYWVMLPDDYENLAESIIATNCFSNNILLSITTYDYWNIANDYKPLMHTWYLGVLMQFYFTTPLFLVIVGKCFKKHRRTAIICSLLIMIAISLALYQFYDDASYHKYYYLQYRLFEFGIGALTFYIASSIKKPTDALWCSYVTIALYVVILSAMMLKYTSIPITVKLLVMDICVALFLAISPTFEVKSRLLKVIQKIGGASLSIFIWHQIIIAFTRYSFTSYLTSLVALPIYAILLIIGGLSYITYKYIESLKPSIITWTTVVCILITTSLFSWHVYNIAGTVRDVPELGAYKGKGYGRMWAAYNYRCFEFDHNFEDNNLPKWLVYGNSFARDFINVVLESNISNKVNISYSPCDINEIFVHRINEADAVFFCDRTINHDLLATVKSLCPTKTPFYIIGTKYFGENNGQVYFHRNNKDYLKSTIELTDFYTKLNEKYKKEYGDYYIDFIEIAQTKDGRIRVFTDDGQFISQDCKHFTQAGAKFYAEHIDWSRFFDNPNILNL